MFNPQNLNRFSYGLNNPSRYTDPDGHFPIPAAIIAGFVILLKVVDYGWTAYDTVNYLSVAANSDNPPRVRKEAMDAALVAVGLELIEPDELSPIALPLDDIVRHGDDIADAGKKAPIVIGETMKRVKETAREIGGKWYQAWDIDPWDFELAMKRNERWIRNKIEEGRKIIDIGLDPKRATRSPFYEMEKRIIKELNYQVKKYVPK